MSEDLIEKSKQVLANIDFNDTTYEVARDVILDEIEKLKNQLEKEKSRYKALQKNSNWFSDRLKDRNEEIERLNNIIKEVREYIEDNFYQSGGCVGGTDLPYSYIEELLEILDKENKDGER